jgi:hypothetical protein
VLQQSSGEVQAVPFCRQVWATQVPWLHISPWQQSVSAVQVAPASLQSQAPLRQVRRAQQSASAVHPLPRATQLQTPDWQCRPTQQSPSVVQVNWLCAQRKQTLLRHSAPVQHLAPPGSSLQVSFSLAQTAMHVPEHSKPEQHSLSSTQLAPSRPQPALHTPGVDVDPSFAQLRFLQQSAFVVQPSPASLQRGALHLPFSQPREQQSSGASQTAPSGRQPATQVSFLHSEPEQQAASTLH